MSIGASIYLAYGTRSLGLVLIACLLVYDLVQNKRPSLFAVTTVVLASTLIYLQNVFSHNDRGYSDQLEFRLMEVALSNSSEFIRLLSEFWLNGYSKIFRLALFATISGLAIAGYFTRIRRQITCFEVFAPLYLGPFVIFPVGLEVRYLLPVIPLYLFYAFLGLRTFTRRVEKEGMAFASLMAIILATYIGQYTRLDFGPLREGVAKSETQQLFEYVKRETGEREIFVSLNTRPTVCSLQLFGAEGTIHLDLFHGYAVVEPGEASRARKIIHPFDLAIRTLSAAAVNLTNRALRWQPAYPGLERLVSEFYRAVQTGSAPPISPADAITVASIRDHLLQPNHTAVAACNFNRR
ncbi:MAG: hypothetical protein ACREEM_30500 [Blastocatellia bacterium]